MLALTPTHTHTHWVQSLSQPQVCSWVMCELALSSSMNPGLVRHPIRMCTASSFEITASCTAKPLKPFGFFVPRNAFSTFQLHLPFQLLVDLLLILLLCIVPQGFESCPIHRGINVEPAKQPHFPPAVQFGSDNIRERENIVELNGGCLCIPNLIEAVQLVSLSDVPEENAALSGPSFLLLQWTVVK